MNNSENNTNQIPNQPINQGVIQPNEQIPVQPLNTTPTQNVGNNVSQQNIPIIQPDQTVQQQEQQPQIIQPLMQNVPTVEQSKQDFINNTQALTPEKKEEKKSGVNYAFIIILFVIIFAAIFFLFPYLLDHI